MNPFISGKIALWALASWAASAESPVGRWKTVDDATGKAKSIISIYLEGKELKAKVDTLFSKPGEDPNRVCEKCAGELKGKRIRGMIIVWGLKSKGMSWEGGRILDPGNGKIYRCALTVNQDNKTLTVRGFVGFSLLGRSQKWERVE